ncbi:hypothetical protein DPMN_146311 [Dreissena polymorpha]|uniref:Uncharacterized protein n=1 Tax=Dreissena polymorpha TaxID=45954 RepID=A0A9D4FBJ0_DREPO|nr:hypothetical protein DPMN_146311 [Dreissena polymorpha]
MLLEYDPRLWTSSFISFPTKYMLYNSHVVSILLYGYETIKASRGHRTQDTGI